MWEYEVEQCGDCEVVEERKFIGERRLNRKTMLSKDLRRYFLKKTINTDRSVKKQRQNNNKVWRKLWKRPSEK